MGGARWRRTRVIPRAIRRFKRRGKKLPEDLAALLTPEAVGTRTVRIMFQDEARFGRMVRIRRCWSPAPSRPKVDNGYQRKFTYVYGAVSPMQGELDWKISPQMNTEPVSYTHLRAHETRHDLV